jgi:HAE1 family hydrophobic/amphiphilic exporter-1
MKKETGQQATAEHGGRSGGGLSAMSIRRPVFTTMIMLGLIVLGIFSFSGLPIDQFPDVDIPVVTVQTVYPGASPETIEREVTRRMEEAFNPVEGVDKITSQTLEGVSVVIVEFELGRDADQASQDLRAKIEGIRRELPADIEQPLVQKFDPSSTPIISLALSSATMPAAELTTLADQTIRRRLETVSGVGEVRITGGLEREIRIYLQPKELQALGVSIGEVMRALQSQNLEVPAGRIERGNTEQLVRVTGRITNPAQFGQIIVATRNGEPIRLQNVARVEDATEEQRSLALLDQSQAISLDILKVSGANTVEVAERVNETVAQLQTTLPQGVKIQVVRDNSVTIKHSVEDVIFELVLGAILTVGS